MIHGARNEYLAAVFVGDEIEVALAVFLFLVGKAVEFFRKGPQGLRQQAQIGYTHRQFARPGPEQGAFSAKYIAQVIMLECGMRLCTRNIVGDVELDAPAHILDRGEACLAHDPL